MTEWIILLVCVIIAAVVGFVLGRQKKSTTASTVGNVDTSELERENKQLKDDYSAVCSKLKEAEAQTENGQKAQEIESKYKKLLSEAKAECKKLDEQLKQAVSGNCDDTIKAQLDEVAKLKKRIADLEDDIEDNEDDIDNYKKKLKKKESELSELQDNYDKESKASKQMSEELALVKRDLEEKTDELRLKMGSLQFIQEILSAKQTKSESIAKLYKDLDFFESLIRGQVLDCYEMKWNEKVGSKQYEDKKKALLGAFYHWAAMKKKSWLDRKTTIAFVGEFSAGKTSIVNRILSQDDKTIPLLPVSTKATTAIPTYIAGGPTTVYSFVTPDNIVKSLSESTFKKVTKEVLDQVKGVSSLIKYFVMTYKNPNLNGLSILDTPGFNSNDSEDKERTIEVINECDALFWVFDVNAGTVNRSSISLIKEKLNKPLYVVINKTDTKPKSEVDKVENLIRKTLEDAGLKVEAYVRFSSKAPLESITNPIKSVGSTAESDTFINDVKEDLHDIEGEYKRNVNDANDVYNQSLSAYNAKIEELNRCVSSICDNCTEAADIPQWTTHMFSKDRYEMSADEGSQLQELLNDIANEQTDSLISNFNDLQELQTEMDDAYSSLQSCKLSYEQIQRCIEQYNNCLLYTSPSPRD